MPRPPKSKIRANILRILDAKAPLHGYAIYQYYLELFPKVHMRSVYYHLKKGVSLKEIKITEIKSHKSDYSWGSEAERVYYELGPEASVSPSKRVRNYFKNLRKNPSNT